MEREVPRIKIKKRVTVKGDKFMIYDYSYDISRKGMRIYSFYKITPGKEVEINFMNDENNPVKLSGKVVWTTEIDDEGQWFSGIVFTPKEHETKELEKLKQILNPNADTENN